MAFTRQQLRRFYLRGIIKLGDYLKYLQMMRTKRDVFRNSSFKLEKYTLQECMNFFRFSHEEIHRLVQVLGIPSLCFTRSHERFTGMEGLCIVLRRLSYPNRYCDLQKMFCRHIAAISRIFNWTLHFIYERVRHLMTSLEHPWLTEECLREFAEITSMAGSRYPNIVGFIDGTARPICRPTYNQELQYSGYKKQHVVKYQSVIFPNGIIGRLDGPMNGRRHDAAILQISRLLPELKRLLTLEDGTWYALYGDPGYANQKYIKVGFKNYQKLSDEQKRFNTDMSVLRISVEYGFGKILQNFAFLDFKKNQKLYLQPLKQMYMVAAVLTNCITCMRGSPVSDFFNCVPPKLEDYINHRMND